MKLGDRVRPRPEWKDDQNRIPTGEVKAWQKFGKDGAWRVGDDPRFWSPHVFEREESTCSDQPLSST